MTRPILSRKLRMERRLAASSARIRRAILRDAHGGAIPNTCGSFSALHDYVDADAYLRKDWQRSGGRVERFIALLIARLDGWLRRGGLMRALEDRGKPTRAQIRALAQRTLHAYSADRYRSWQACVALLLRRGLSERQAEAILLSKWMRWAADNSSKRYGYATSADLRRFLSGISVSQIYQLEQEHFQGVPEVAQ